MPRSRPVLVITLGTILCIASILTPRHSIADEVPATALSKSLSIPSEVPDHPALLFRYPQRAPLLESQGFAFVGSVESRSAGGGIVRSGKLGGFVIAQPLDYPSNAILGSDPILFQAGVGIQRDWLRAGAAVRAASLIRDGSSREEGDPFPEDGSFGRTNRLIEPAFGLGFDRADHRIDLEVSLADLTHRYRVAESDGTGRLDLVSDPIPNFSARLDLAIGKRSRAILIGSYAGSDVEWEAQASRQGSTIAADERIWRDDWSSTVAWITTTGSLDWLAVHGSYRAQRDGSANLSGDRLLVQRSTDRKGTIGLSARRTIYQTLDLLAGVSGSYELARDERAIRQMATALVRTTTTESESASDRFSWGASYSWKGIRLAGAMNTSLSLSSMFYSIDLQVAP